METLLEDYTRKLNSVNEMIEDLKDVNENDPTYVRLITKRSCFRTFITELKREIKNNSQYSI